VQTRPRQGRVAAQDPCAGDVGQPVPGRHGPGAVASGAGPGRLECEGGPTVGLDRDLDGEREVAAEGDRHGQQVPCERRRVTSVAGQDVAHRPGRQEGAGRDLACRFAADRGVHDAPDHLDGVEPAMKDAAGQHAAGPSALPAAPPPNHHRGALRSPTDPAPLAAPVDQATATCRAARDPRPDRWRHVGGRMRPETAGRQPAVDSRSTPSPISAAIFGRFVPIESCRQHQDAGALEVVLVGIAVDRVEVVPGPE
jgi:hypothetical protein